MKSLINYPVKVIATGFIILLFLSLPLFWARWFCKSLLGNIMPLDWRSVTIEPCGLVPAEHENDPNVLRRSRVHAHIIHPEAPQALGIADYFSSRILEGRHSHVYYLDPTGEDSAWIYFDEKIGQIVCRWTDTQRMPDGTSMRKQVQLYIGPEGVSEIPDKTLGRFIDPIIDSEHIYPLILYDKKLRRFFKIDFNKRKVIKGPQLSKDDPYKPIDMGILSKNPYILDLFWSPPEIKTSDNYEEKIFYSRRGYVPIREKSSDYRPDQYLPVLDESGRIDLLDKETLEFAGAAGHLPAPKALFPSEKRATPEDLLAYRVLPLALKTDRKYRGLFAASVSREGTALALAVFDEKGKQIKTEHTKLPKHRGSSTTDVYSSTAAFFEAPWAPVSTICKYLAENLHPPILSIASYFTASVFEAGAGHRALFFLPNSFIAMKGRDTRGNIAERFISALLIILPSIILAMLLAWRVSKDAAVVGLSKNVRLFWIIGTLAFGLAGYITYRLTKPKITLVTCANCGNPRRPDMDRCHRCGSKWHVPELTQPTWRVLDAGQQVHEGFSAPPEQAAEE